MDFGIRLNFLSIPDNLARLLLFSSKEFTMKALIKKLFLFSVIAVCLVLSGCKSSDELNENENPLIGTWDCLATLVSAVPNQKAVSRNFTQTDQVQGEGSTWNLIITPNKDYKTTTYGYSGSAQVIDKTYGKSLSATYDFNVATGRVKVVFTNLNDGLWSGELTGTYLDNGISATMEVITLFGKSIWDVNIVITHP
jgi:hypothetical protein